MRISAVEVSKGSGDSLETYLLKTDFSQSIDFSSSSAKGGVEIVTDEDVEIDQFDRITILLDEAQPLSLTLQNDQAASVSFTEDTAKSFVVKESIELNPGEKNEILIYLDWNAALKETTEFGATERSFTFASVARAVQEKASSKLTGTVDKGFEKVCIYRETQPIAQVLSCYGAIAQTSAKNGSFTFEDLSPGNYKFVFYIYDFKYVEYDSLVEVKEAEELNLNFAVSPDGDTTPATLSEGEGYRNPCGNLTGTYEGSNNGSFTIFIDYNGKEYKSSNGSFTQEGEISAKIANAYDLVGRFANGEIVATIKDSSFSMTGIYAKKKIFGTLYCN